MVFHRKAIAKKFAHPHMLRNCGGLLVEDELEAVMIHTYSESTTPKVGSPIFDSFDEVDEFTLVRWELLVVGHHNPAEKSYDPITLV
jgi:hypothetical protein